MTIEGLTNKWVDYGGLSPSWACKKSPEYCRTCGKQLVLHVEITKSWSRSTGKPTFQRYHSCPTWVTGWRTSWWAKGWACPGMNHESHDADNPLSSRGYR